MTQPHRQKTAGKQVAGQWAQQQKTWVDKDRQKSERTAQHQQATPEGARATDDEPTDGEWAEKRRQKMQLQDKAEGERRD